MHAGDAAMTADLIDAACEIEQMERDQAINEARSKAGGRQFLPVGVCYNCGEDVPASALYCDQMCRDDHGVRLKAAVRNGLGE